MRSKKEGAAALTTTPSTNQLKVKYQKQPATSSRNLKHDMGELLWSLQFPVGELSQTGWKLFERLLRRYVGLVVPHQSVSEQAGTTISPQGVSG